MNIEQFCLAKSEPTLYPAMWGPFRMGKWLYATDGRICVRVPARTKALPSTGKVPRADNIFKDFDSKHCTEPWPNSVLVRIGESLNMHAEYIGGRSLNATHWFNIACLGSVRFNPRGKPSDPIQFVRGKLQGVVMPVLASTDLSG